MRMKSIRKKWRQERERGLMTSFEHLPLVECDLPLHFSIAWAGKVSLLLKSVWDGLLLLQYSKKLRGHLFSFHQWSRKTAWSFSL